MREMATKNRKFIKRENLGFVKTKEGILKKILWNKEKKQICEIKIF
jgi:hypothetical protein